MDDAVKKKLLKMLVALAWADGRVDAEEMEIVYAVVDSFGVDAATKEEIVSWAKTPRSLDDVDTEGLTEEDAELVLFQAVVLTFIDGEQSDKEVALLNAFVEKLGMSKERAEAVLDAATARAKTLLPELEA
jgi:uncharacterized membrane protein YebE (DUF533 family)